MTTVLLLSEQGPGIGLGHRRRMEALAAALRRVGLTCDLREIGDERPIEHRVIVVDSYAERADDLRFGAEYVVAIDDLERNLAVDLAIHPAPLSADAPLQAASRVLAGLEYALIDDAPIDSPLEGDAGETVVLISLGTSDSAGLGAAVALAVAERSGCAVRHAAGPWSTPSTDPRVERIVAPDGLLREMLAADVVVTAGGVTMLEALRIGRPTIVVPTAENQMRAVSAVGRAQAAVVLNPDVTVLEIAAAVEGLRSDHEAQRELSDRARQTVDGQGAARAAGAILELL